MGNRKYPELILNFSFYNVRDLPRSIMIGIPLVTVCYVLVNIAYLTVLSPAEILTSSAVAVVSKACSVQSEIKTEVQLYFSNGLMSEKRQYLILRPPTLSLQLLWLTKAISLIQRLPLAIHTAEKESKNTLLIS